MIQSIACQRAPVSRVSGVSPTAVLFQRAAEKKLISSGCCTETVMPSCRPRIGPRVSCVSGVGCVSVKREVASLLRPMASASLSRLPRQSLEGLLQKSRRAAAADKFERIAQRLADKPKSDALAGSGVMRRFGVQPVELPAVQLRDVASVSDLASVSGVASSCSVASSPASSVRASEFASSSGSGVPLRERPGPSASSEVVCVMSKVASVVSVASVASRALVASAPVQSVASGSFASQSVGEWLQVGDALSSVLGRLRVIKAAAGVASSNDDSRMH